MDYGDDYHRQQWNEARRVRALAANDLSAYRERGSPRTLLGMLALLVLTGLIGSFAYLWATFDLFGESAHPLDGYVVFALFAWIMAAAGAVILWLRPLPRRYYRLQLLVPVFLLGIWLTVVFTTDPYPASTFGLPDPGPATVRLRIEAGWISTDTYKIEAGRQVFRVENATGGEVRFGIIRSVTPFTNLDSARTFHQFLETPNGTTCFITACSLPEVALGPGEYVKWRIDCEPGYYAVAAVRYDGTNQRLAVDPAFEPVIIAVTN